MGDRWAGEGEKSGSPYTSSMAYARQAWAGASFSWAALTPALLLTSIPFLYSSILRVAWLISGILHLPCWLLCTALPWVTNSASEIEISVFWLDTDRH